MSLRRPLIWLTVLSLAGLTACGGEVEDTRPGQPVKTRRTAFKEILRAFEPMGTMLRTERYEPEKFVLMATELLAKRDAPWAHFGADTLYPPSKAKADVWNRPAEFARERQAFIAATDELLAAAQTKQRDAAEKAYFKVYDLCQSCHKGFKEK